VLHKFAPFIDMRRRKTKIEEERAIAHQDKSRCVLRLYNKYKQTIRKRLLRSNQGEYLFMADQLRLTESNCNFKWGIEFTKALSNSNRFCRGFLKKTIKAMVNEFDMYAKATNQVPWWYNERALLGFYAAGIARCTRSVLLQEYSCNKAGRKERIGRADLWIRYKDSASMRRNHSLLFEAKHMEVTSFSYATKWDYKGEEEAMRQACKYAKSPEDSIDFIGSLYFTTIRCYYAKSAEIVQKWTILDGFPKQLNGYFYCIVKLLKHSNVKCYMDENWKVSNAKKAKYAYPALCISGILLPYKAAYSHFYSR